MAGPGGALLPAAPGPAAPACRQRQRVVACSCRAICALLPATATAALSPGMQQAHLTLPRVSTAGGFTRVCVAQAQRTQRAQLSMCATRRGKVHGERSTAGRHLQQRATSNYSDLPAQPLQHGSRDAADASCVAMAQTRQLCLSSTCSEATTMQPPLAAMLHVETQRRTRGV